MSQLKFIDLFCGIGGFHQSMNKLNYKCVFACDIDEDCRKTYEKNYNLKPEGDINNVVVENIPPFDILCGAFPCQPFSQAGKQKGFNDNRGNVFYKICSIIEFHNPKYILLENVKTLKSHNKGQTWQIIKTKIRELNYDIYDEPLIINTLLYNIPQYRDRAFILGINKNEGKLPTLPIIPKLIKKKLTCSIDDIIINDDVYNKKYKISTKVKNIKNIFRYIFHKDQSGTTKPKLEFKIIRSDFSLFETRIRPIDVRHGFIPVLGYRIDDMAYITDCNHIPEESEKKLEKILR